MIQANRIVSLAVLLAVGLTGCGAERTAAPSLSLTLTAGEARHPTAAVDAETGTVYFAWIAQEAGAANVYLARLEAGRETVEAQARVNHQPGDAKAHGQAPAQVVVGSDGEVYVAWTNQFDVEGRRFPPSDLRFARSTDGGRTFAPAVSVNDDAGGLPSGHTFHDLAAGPTGTVYVSWLDTRERDRAQAALASRPAVPVQHAAHDPHGHAGTDALPGTELRVARSTDGGRSFSPSVVVARGTCQCCRTAVTAAADGTVYVAWRHLFEDGARDIALARSDDDGRTFSAPVRVHADGWQIDGCPHSGPAIAVDDAGRVHVTWYTGVEDGAGLYYAVSGDGGRSFGAPAALATGVPVAHARLTRAAGGRIWIAWEDPLQQQIHLAETDGQQAPAAQGTPALSGSAPSVAATGNVRVVAWQEGDRLRAHVERSDG